jgi:hypothetical protein
MNYFHLPYIRHKLDLNVGTVVPEVVILVHDDIILDWDRALERHCAPKTISRQVRVR